MAPPERTTSDRTRESPRAPSIDSSSTRVTLAPSAVAAVTKASANGPLPATTGRSPTSTPSRSKRPAARADRTPGMSLPTNMATPSCAPLAATCARASIRSRPSSRWSASQSPPSSTPSAVVLARITTEARAAASSMRVRSSSTSIVRPESFARAPRGNDDSEPPACGASSTSTTESPSRASAVAAASPAGPPPTTSTSCRIVCTPSRRGSCVLAPSSGSSPRPDTRRAKASITDCTPGTPANISWWFMPLGKNQSVARSRSSLEERMTFCRSQRVPSRAL